VNSHLIEIFEDEELKVKIQKNPPYLFNIAESSRRGGAARPLPPCRSALSRSRPPWEGEL
jgi:hypothetical protein